MFRRRPEWQRLNSGLFLPRPLGFGVHWPCFGCCGCDCAECDGSPPCCFKVVISGVVEGTCGECSCLNDTYHAKHSSACTWTRDTSAYPCDSDPLRVTVFDDGGNFKLKVELGGNVWIKDFGGTKPTCGTLTDESIPFDSSGSDCDASSSTCLVTAVAEDDDVNCPAPAIPECSRCICGLYPKNGFQIVIAGLKNSGSCSDCVSLNGTYIVTPVGATSPCRSRFTFISPQCSTTQLVLDFGGLSSFSFRVFTQDPDNPVPPTAFLFRKVDTGDEDCLNLVNENIPISAGSGSCDTTTAPAPTCLITSL